jgi:hypothetical protein
MECMENNSQIQMSETSQIQAKMKNHWKEDLHSRWPRTSGYEQRQRWLCNLNIIRKSLFLLVEITPYSLKIRKCIMSANMLYKEWQQRKMPFCWKTSTEARTQQSSRTQTW